MIKAMTSKLSVPPVADEPTQEPHGTPGLPSRSEFEPVAPVTKPHRNVLLLVSLLALALLVGAGFGGYRFYLAHQAKPTAAKTATQANQTLANAAPPVDVATLGGIKAAYVTLPLTADEAATDPIKGPSEMIATASGHYLLRDLRGSSYAHHNTGGKLLYDGQTIYDGPYLWTFELSQNGEHYLYTLDTTAPTSSGNIEVYVDGKLVQSFAENKWLFYPQVSNDGQHYAYVTNGAYPTSIVMKDGKAIYTNSYVETIFNADLSRYIALTQRNTDYYNVVVNGTQIASNVPFLEANALTAISNNGQHYLYRNGNALFEDGREVATSKSIEATAVTDTGAYALADMASNNLIINGKNNAIPTTLTQDCTPTCSYQPPIQMAISPAGDHYIIGTQALPFWYVDGAQVRPDGNVEGVEFVGDTLYLYRWAQPTSSTFSTADSAIKANCAKSGFQSCSVVVDKTEGAFVRASVNDTTPGSPGTGYEIIAKQGHDSTWSVAWTGQSSPTQSDAQTYGLPADWGPYASN